MRLNELILMTAVFVIVFCLNIFAFASTSAEVLHRAVRSTMSSKIINIDIVRPTSGKHTGTVIFLHGSGGTGLLAKAGIEMIFPKASFPHLKIMYPTAPMRPYTPLDGEPSNVWFDRVQVAPNCPEHLETINPMAEELVSLIDKEVQSGIPRNRIVIGGFSMGGAMSLHLGYRFVQDVAGVFCLSSFLNDNSTVYKELEEKKPQQLPPLFYAHGDLDDLVYINWGHETFDLLKKLGVQGEFHTVPSAFHEIRRKEMETLFNWINQLLPNN